MIPPLPPTLRDEPRPGKARPARPRKPKAEGREWTVKVALPSASPPHCLPDCPTSPTVTRRPVGLSLGSLAVTYSCVAPVSMRAAATRCRRPMGLEAWRAGRGGHPYLPEGWRQGPARRLMVERMRPTPTPQPYDLFPSLRWCAIQPSPPPAPCQSDADVQRPSKTMATSAATCLVGS